MGASSQEASQTASSQAALPKGSPMADMEEVEDSAEPGTTEENRLSHKSLRFEISVDFLNMHLEQSMQLEDQSNPCS